MLPFGIGHNGGPPLDAEETSEHVPPWEDGDPFVYLAWVDAHRRAWRHLPWDTLIRRQERAEALGLTYEEYTLEILERGRHLSGLDAARIAAIKAGRRRPVLLRGGQAPEPPDAAEEKSETDRVSPMSPAWGLIARARRRQRRG